MKQFKSFLATLALLLCCVPASAHDFEVDGIYYNIISIGDLTVEVTYRGSNYDSYYNEYSGSVVIPESVTYNSKTYSVTSIGDNAFSDCRSLTSITLFNSVTSIGIRAFYYCRGLTSITIPNSVTSIGKQALYYCDSLILVSLGDSIRSIGDDAFRDCSSLISVTIPNRVIDIGGYAFSGCSSLASVTIGSNVKNIGSYAFYHCSNLRTVINQSNLNITKGSSDFGYVSYYAYRVLTGEPIDGFYFEEKDSAYYLTGYVGDEKYIVLPKSYKGCSYGIGTNAFRNCDSLISITIPNGVISIGNSAFLNCDGLTSIIIPNSVTSIGGYAFYECYGLTSITIPSSITKIRGYAFYGCYNLRTIINQSNLNITKYASDYGYVAYYAYRVLTGEPIDGFYFEEKDSVYYLTGYVGDEKSVVLPKSYKGNSYCIGDNAFRDYISLTSVIIPNSVTYIGYFAFADCSRLTSVTIGNSVTYIGVSAFSQCDSLNCLNVLANIPPYAYNDTFSNYDVELYVPEKSINSYQSATPWSKFAIIKQLYQFNNFQINDTTIRSSQSLLLPVSFNNESEFTVLECNVYLPNGISLQKNSGKYDITLDENRIVDHTVSSALQEDGSIKMYVVSLTNSLLEGKNGNLFYLNLKADEGFTGEAIVSIKNIVASAADGTRYDLEDVMAKITVKPYTLGDVNDDGQVIVNDVVLTINYALGTKVEDFVFEAADINGDGEIVVDDIVKIINIILGVNTASEAPMHRAEAQGEADKFYISDFNIAAGETKALAIQLESNNTGSDPAQLNYVAFQFDIYLPEGLKVDVKRGKYNFAFNEARKDNHTLTFADQADGAIRVIGASLSNGYFWETSGDFVTFSVTAGDGFTGAKQLYLKNIKFSTKAGERADLEDVTVNINNDATGIENISSETGLNGNVYSIQGQKVSNAGNTNSLPRGLYIINGKKVVKD